MSQYRATNGPKQPRLTGDGSAELTLERALAGHYAAAPSQPPRTTPRPPPTASNTQRAKLRRCYWEAACHGRSRSTKAWSRPPSACGWRESSPSASISPTVPAGEAALGSSPSTAAANAWQSSAGGRGQPARSSWSPISTAALAAGARSASPAEVRRRIADDAQRLGQQHRGAWVTPALLLIVVVAHHGRPGGRLRDPILHAVEAGEKAEPLPSRPTPIAAPAALLPEGPCDSRVPADICGIRPPPTSRRFAPSVPLTSEWESITRRPACRTSVE